MESHLQFRLSKIGQSLFKQEKYEVRVNSTIIGNVNYQNPKLSQEFEAGKYTIEVFENEHYVRKDIILNAGQTQMITVEPSLSHLLSVGLTIGLATGTLIFQVLIVDKISIPLIFLSIIPFFLLIKKKNSDNDFDLTIKKISI